VNKTVGFPRMAAAFDYHHPLRFEDEFDVSIRIAAMSDKTIRYTCELTRDGGEDRHRHPDDRLRQHAAGRADEGRLDSGRDRQPVHVEGVTRCP
jgi:hypothetical protein